MAWSAVAVALGCSLILRRDDVWLEWWRGVALFIGGFACGFILGL